jgi:hypothetical protein
VNERRVLLGIVTSGKPTTPFLDALANLTLPSIVAPLSRSVAVGNYVPAQRELIMNDAIENSFDYLFFVDDDIVLPNDALEMLVQTAEADPGTAVVGGLYYGRDSIRPMTVADWDSTDTSTAHTPAFTSQSTDTVAGVGFGCALLRVSVARKLTPPYFAAQIFIERSARRARLCNEDYLYCERVRKTGNAVRLDARVRCPHYDRETESVAPGDWESNAVTALPRMLVSEFGVPHLVPLDASVPRVEERHERAELTYIIVE